MHYFEEENNSYTIHLVVCRSLVITTFGFDLSYFKLVRAYNYRLPEEMKADPAIWRWEGVT